ncbi:hypothetical protein, partial [Streptomyces sp. NPDC047939]|uniref:hypothetical protein n=1 Tax=Streptomyces sp. NPDC047939 TaxID=3155381 RepID=UPI00342AF676
EWDGWLSIERAEATLGRSLGRGPVKIPDWPGPPLVWCTCVSRAAPRCPTPRRPRSARRAAGPA